MLHSKLQMEKVFYSDHYYVDILWDFEENLDKDENGKQIVVTSLKLKSNLQFTKNVALVQKKI